MPKPVIQLFAALHRGEKRMLLQYENLPQINEAVKKIAGIRWSQTKKCWHLPMNRESYNALILHAGDKVSITSKEKKHAPYG